MAQNGHPSSSILQMHIMCNKFCAILSRLTRSIAGLVSKKKMAVFIHLSERSFSKFKTIAGVSSVRLP